MLSAPPTRLEAAGRWISGYYVGYAASEYPPSAIDFSSLTHVLMFSVLPKNDGDLDTSFFVDPVNGPKIAMDVAQRAHAAGIAALLTVGGSDTQTGFQRATSPQNMNRFVQNLVQTISNLGYDGVDIDWEPMSAADFPSILTLIRSLRAARPGIMVSVAVAWQNINFPLSIADARFYAQLSDLVDHMNIMTYGMSDNWGGWLSWHSSALFGETSGKPSSVSSSARMYTNAGVPPAKIGVGIGFYGSCWNQPVTGPSQSPGSSHVVADDNTMSFANIQNHYYAAANYRYDTTAEAPYLTFASPVGPAGCTFISYEDERSVAAKGAYVRDAGLGGVIVWQLNEGFNSRATDTGSLLHAVGRAFLGAPMAGTATVSVVSGSGQWANVGEAFQSPLVAQVRDVGGNPVSGVTVGFSTPTSGASAFLNGASTVGVKTDSRGFANAAAVANSVAGTYVVTAVLTDSAAPARFELTNTAAAGLTVTPVGTTSQSASLSHSFPKPLRVLVTDQHAKRRSGVQVTFAAPPEGASATFGNSGSYTVTVRSNAMGVATSPLPWANAISGSYLVTATATGASSTAFYLANGRQRNP